MKITPRIHSYSLSSAPSFPALWTVVLDELVPAFVKQRFSPHESWKNKPFTQDDVVFFSKGLMELSDFFTEDRLGSKLPNYFTTARFRSSYFLYFFALQGAKFLTLFDRYPQAVESTLQHAIETGTLRLVDVGAGPGTASIAILVYVLNRYSKAKKLPFKVELEWIDYNETILKDGELFLNSLLAHFSDFEGDIRLKTDARQWWKHPANFNYEASLVLFGNVLNESSHDQRVYAQGLVPFFKSVKGGGVLFVEPAFKSASQRVGQIRDELMPRPIWGPCFHQEKCPLANGRDWCHFSVPVSLPGKFFKKFSVKLGSVRDWLKFSFVWIAADQDRELVPSAPHSKLNLARVVSDPMKTPRGNQNQICEPVQIKWLPTPKRPLFRGEVIAETDLITPKKSDFPKGKPIITPKEKALRGMKASRSTDHDAREESFRPPSPPQKSGQKITRKITDTRDSPDRHPAIKAQPRFKNNKKS